MKNGTFYIKTGVDTSWATFVEHPTSGHTAWDTPSRCFERPLKKSFRRQKNRQNLETMNDTKSGI